MNTRKFSNKKFKIISALSAITICSSIGTASIQAKAHTSLPRGYEENSHTDRCERKPRKKGLIARFLDIPDAIRDSVISSLID